MSLGTILLIILAIALLGALAGWNRGALTPPRSVVGIVDDRNNGHLLGNVQCEGYVCLHSVAQPSGLLAEWGCGTSAARQKSTIWSRTGSDSCSYSTIRRG